MNKVILFLATVLLFMTWCSEANKRNKACYNAKICIHTGREKCGIDKKGKVRRFYDSCDLLEYNCLYNTTYIKIKEDRCEHLPAIEPKKKSQDF